MKNEGLLYVAAAALCLAWLFTPANTHAAKNRGFNINIEGSAESCGDLKARSSGEIAQVNDTFTLSKGEAPILELNAADRGHIRVRGVGPRRLLGGNLQDCGGGDARRCGTDSAGHLRSAHGGTNLL
jgi:hypothetical protein